MPAAFWAACEQIDTQMTRHTAHLWRVSILEGAECALVLKKHSVRLVLVFSDPSRSPFGDHLERHESRGCVPNGKWGEEQTALMGAERIEHEVNSFQTLKQVSSFNAKDDNMALKLLESTFWHGRCSDYLCVPRKSLVQVESKLPTVHLVHLPVSEQPWMQWVSGQIILSSQDFCC